jgi:hypothetical protein
LDYIAGLNANDVNRGNMQTNIANAISGMERQRNTLAADTANKAAIQKLAVEKASHENAYHDALAEGNVQSARLHKAEADNYANKIAEASKVSQAQIRASDASAGAHGRSGYDRQVFDHPDGTQHAGIFAGKKLVTDLGKALPKDLASGSGGGDPWDANVRRATALKSMVQKVDKDGLPVGEPSRKLDSVIFKAYKEQFAKEGKNLVSQKLGPLVTKAGDGLSDKEAIEIPIFADENGKIYWPDLVEALINNYGYTREEAMAHVKTLKPK